MNPTPNSSSCPECEHGPSLGRRDFLRTVGALALGTAAAPKLRAKSKAAEASEDLVRELFVTLSGGQKKKLVLPWNHGAENGKGVATRLNTYNGPINKLILGDEYSKSQVDLLGRLFKSLGNGDEGFRQLSRGGTFDASGAFENISAVFFGDPTGKEKFALVFGGHHLTVRCDGNSEEGAAFGGPLYYGHTPNGYSDKNVFIAQTKAATELFRTIDDKQRPAAVKDGKWVDGVASVKLPAKGHAPAGLAYSAMTKEQREMTEKVMRQLIAPYRKEDGDEVMDIIKTNGGMEKLALAFYKEGMHTEKEPWSHWRLEGPGFVWSFRALPHIHTFVNISSKLA